MVLSLSPLVPSPILPYLEQPLARHQQAESARVPAASPFVPHLLPPHRRSNPFLPQVSQPSIYPLPLDSHTSNTYHRLSSPAKCMTHDSLQDRGSHAAGYEKTFPRICIWESNGAAGDITCDIIDTVEVPMLYKHGVGGKGPVAGGFQPGAQTPRRDWRSRSPDRSFPKDTDTMI